MLYVLFLYSFLRRGCVILDYVIRNNKKVYIKLNENGAAVTCSEAERGVFEYSKAKNILNCLPKTLRKLHFRVDPVPEISKKIELKEVVNELVKKEEYTPSENITRWIEKFGKCEDVFAEAKEREKELILVLKNSDKELLDILHIIEIEPPKDLYGGWKLYKWIKRNRKERREIKDELIIIDNVLREINPTYLKRSNVQKAIDGLFGRKYTFRIVEEEDKNANL